MGEEKAWADGARGSNLNTEDEEVKRRNQLCWNKKAMPKKTVRYSV